MIYGYVRVSTDKQMVLNQKFEIQKFCEKKDFEVEKWISETISATKSFQFENLASFLGICKKAMWLLSAKFHDLVEIYCKSCVFSMSVWRGKLWY